MRPRLAASFAALALAGAAVPAVASGERGARVEHASAHAVAGDLGPATGVPARWALAALAAHADRLGVDAGAFRVEQVRTSLIGTHVRGRQYRSGLPVAGTTLLVSALSGRVAQVDAFGSGLPGLPAEHPVGELVARAAALDSLRATRLLVPAQVERLFVPVGGTLVDAYRVSVVAARPAVAAVVVVAAETGRVLSVKDEARRVDGKARVFDPNPMQATGNAALREPGVDSGLGPDTDLDSAELTAARSLVPVRGLDATALTQTRLQGPYVNILGMAGYVASGDVPVFDVTRGDPRFEGLMAYAHIDRFQRYLQGLGFKGSKSVNAESQEVVTTRVEGYDNSFYQPSNDIMLLGAGGVDDGEDAEVILHEYGHAMQDAQVSGWGETNEGGAMGEGFGDFVAADYFARTSKGARWDLCVAEWDATSYSSANPPCLRRLDSKKRYPKDVQEQVHADGEMWSAYLWRVRSRLPGNAVQKSDAMMRLVVTSHELLTSKAEFADAVAALRTAARALKRPEYVRLIDTEAKRTGFDLNP